MKRTFANSSLLIAIMVCLAVVAWALVKGGSGGFTLRASLFFIALPGVIAAALLAGFRLQLEHRFNLALLTVSSCLAVYLVEAIFAFTGFAGLSSVAGEWGIPDRRSKIEVLRDLRRNGTDAYPAVFPQAITTPITIGGRATLPLGGIANVTTVLCNEFGTWVDYRSDEHGFRNPAGIWGNKKLQVAIVGDSFAHGSCVPAGETMAAHVRKRYPATLNLGMAGNGPLLMLAGLREYLPALKPAAVLWFYWEANDLRDLGEERKRRFLMRYLRGDIDQNLVHRQAELDNELKRRYRDPDAEAAERPRFEVSPSLANILLLRNIRHSLRLLAGPVRQAQSYRYPRPPEAVFELLPRILAGARDTVESWGGKFYFIYLPGWHVAEVAAGGRNPNNPDRQRVLSIVETLGIPIIDLYPVFRREPDPGTLMYGFQSHYTSKGDRIVAETTMSAIAPSLNPDSLKSSDLGHQAGK